MINYLVRAGKRFAVLIPGIVIAYFSVRKVFPWFDKQFPLAIAIFLTYVLGAYVLIPGLLRIVRWIVPARHLQAYCITPDGFASDPVNIGIIGNRQQLITAMEAAGWSVADKHSVRNVIKQIVSVLLGEPYPSAPMSSLYLFGRKQDIGFEIPIKGGTGGQRHHVRFWATVHKGDELSFGTVSWHTRRGEPIGKDTLWVGAASRDTGFAFIRHNVQITHMIDPDTNAERELIVRGLRRRGLVASTRSVKLHSPYALVNRALLGVLHSDGVLKIIKLK